MNRDYGILSNRYHDLSNLLFQASADEEVLERGQGERLRVMQPASLPMTSSFPNRLALLGGGIALTLLIALAIPFGLFYTDTSFKDSDDISAEFADVNAIAISRVPEAVHRYLNGEIKSAEAPLALAGNGVGGESPATGFRESTNGGQTAADGESANHNGADGESASHNGTNGNLVPLTGRAARFAERYPAPPLVAAGENVVSTAADEFQLLAFKLRSWAAQHDNAKVFVVASAVGGEGKSFVALNLAAALAVWGGGTLLNRCRYPRAFSALCFPGAESGRAARISAGNHRICCLHTADSRAGPQPDALGRNQQSRPGISGFQQNGPADGNDKVQEGLPVHYNRYPAGVAGSRRADSRKGGRWHSHRNGGRQHCARRDHQDVSHVRSSESVRGRAEPVQAFVIDPAQRALRPLWTLREIRALREILEILASIRNTLIPI